MDVLKQKKRLGFFGLIKQIFNWYPSEYPAAERKLLFKLDLSILVFSCLCYFGKYLDQSNISNAYTSGMREELGLYGNQLNYLNICYYSAYVIFQVPGLMLLSRPSLTRWLLPSLEVLWGIATFAHCKATNINQLYALRFIVGMLESPVFAGVHFVLGSWYSGPELFKRAGAWYICSPLGSMISGYLQAAAYTHLSGVRNMAGWRWLFIIDGVITVPSAIIGYLIFPGMPDSPRCPVLTEADIQLSKERLARFHIRRPGRLDGAVFRRTLGRWHIWVFVFCYISMIISDYPNSYMNLWLKSEHYSVPQINRLPTVINAISILSSWLGSSLASIYPPWIIYTVVCGCSTFSFICMTIWYIPRGLKFVAWYLLGLHGCASPILYSTVNTVVHDDSEERALIMGTMMTFGYSFNLWVPLLAFPTAGKYGAPRWRRGWPISVVFQVFLYSGFITAVLLYRRRLKREAAQVDHASESEPSAAGEITVLREEAGTKALAK